MGLALAMPAAGFLSAAGLLPRFQLRVLWESYKARKQLRWACETQPRGGSCRQVAVHACRSCVFACGQRGVLACRRFACPAWNSRCPRSLLFLASLYSELAGFAQRGFIQPCFEAEEWGCSKLNGCQVREPGVGD